MILPKNQSGIIHTLPLLVVIASIGVISFLLISSTLPVGGLFGNLFPKNSSHAANNTFTPTVIPITNSVTDEIPNQLRGQYTWYQQSLLPSGWPSNGDRYYRYRWSELESCQGCYDFSHIDNELQTAKNNGGKFGFAIFNVALGDANDMPQYVANGSNSWQYNYEGVNITIPDWNSNFYLTRWEALHQALANRYANDPRLGFIEIGGFGDWGEWHTWPWDSAGPNGQAQYLTTANFTRLINATVKNFPNTKVLMRTSGIWTSDTSATPLETALNMSPLIGIRNDCVGTSNLGGDASYLQSSPLAFNRWKTAPWVGEWCNNGSISLLPQQVQTYHISTLGRNNPDPNQDLNSWILGYKTMGYRYVLKQVVVPDTLTPGGTFNVSASWSNVNVAPTYDNWNLIFQLKNSSGAVAWSSNSTINLKSLLGGGDPSQNQTINDNFTLPSTLPTGSYTLAVIVKDPTNYLAPMRLAITGRQSDGSYNLGSVSVGTPCTSNCPTPAPTPIGGTWTYCADEFSKCNFTGTAQVRYGANGIYNYGTFTNGVACDNTIFGDPVPDAYKTCEYQPLATPTPVPTPTPSPTSTPIAASKPAIPTGLTATGGNGSVTLSWNANPAGENVDLYQVYEGDQVLNLNIPQTTYTTTTDHLGGTLVNGTTYSFRVSAHNVAGYSPWGNAVTAIPTSTPAAIPGDLDGNRVVNIFDYNILVSNFGRTGSGIQGDIDKNGVVNIFDYNILVSNFGRTS